MFQCLRCGTHYLARTHDGLCAVPNCLGESLSEFKEGQNQLLSKAPEIKISNNKKDKPKTISQAYEDFLNIPYKIEMTRFKYFSIMSMLGIPTYALLFSVIYDRDIGSFYKSPMLNILFMLWFFVSIFYVIFASTLRRIQNYGGSEKIIFLYLVPTIAFGVYIVWGTIWNATLYAIFTFMLNAMDKLLLFSLINVISPTKKPKQPVNGFLALK